jgi:hypothetical protein
MAKGRHGGVKTASFLTLGIAALSTALIAVIPTAAQAATVAAAQHGMGLKRSAGAVVAPTAGLRALATIGATTGALPAAVDLTKYAEKVGDQGQVNSCAAWAIGYAMMGWFARSQGHTGVPYAPMYVYSQVNGGHDGGSSPADVMDVLRDQGIDTAAQYAVNRTQSTFNWSKLPTAAERKAAAANKTTGWVTLYNTYNSPGAVAVTALKRTLASGRPAAVAIAVYSNFMNAHGTTPVTTTGLGRLLGYHEVLAVGYDSRGLRIQNSWGTGWADKGFTTLDWNYVAQYSYEAETIGGLVTTTGVNRPVVTTVSSGAGSYLGGEVVTVTGSKLFNAIVTLGTSTFSPYAISADGRTLAFAVPKGTAGIAAPLRISTPGGTSVKAVTYRYVR